jgi:assimilatory nitrate reductase catalytic subunit
VCACFSVGAATIATAVKSGCATVAAVGQKVKAGTNCGSCRPEIARLIVACDVGREK